MNVYSIRYLDKRGTPFFYIKHEPTYKEAYQFAENYCEKNGYTLITVKYIQRINNAIPS